MGRLAWLAGIGAFVTAMFAFVACGSKGNKFDMEGGSDDDGPVIGDETPIIPGDGGPTEGGTCGKCSGDLHNVLDCDGKVVQTCPADQGCAGGICDRESRNRTPHPFVTPFSEKHVASG